ncbi:MAG: YqeG family HAD IIIA-type phosphatase [Bacillota bacterium]|jgi:HAD superfamily phosphatase (TIGR01668 family)
MLGLITPDAYLESICKIDIEELEKQGVKTLLFDVDNTITTWNCPEIDADVINWFAELHKSSIKGCIISNNSAERLQGIADELGLFFEAKAKKPLPFGYKRAMNRLNSDQAGTVMVGDQLFTDVLGAGLAGIRSILLKPISTLHEFKGTRINRQMEKVVMKSVMKKMRKKQQKLLNK